MMQRRQPESPAEFRYNPALPRFADVSHWNPEIRWPEYGSNCACHMIAIKMTEGSSPARLGAVRLALARNAGLTVIGYAFGAAHPETFLRAFPPAPHRIPCLDFEGLSATVSQAEAWLAVVGKEWGRPPWFYGRHEWIIQGAPQGTSIESCPYWGSQYSEHLLVPAGVGRPVAWQFTDGKRAHGPAIAPRTFAGIKPIDATTGCDISSLLVPISEVL